MSKKSTYRNTTDEKELQHAEAVPQIDAFKLFSLVLPKWAYENEKGVSFLVKADPSSADGLEIQTGMSKNATMEDLDNVMHLLERNEEFLRMKFLFHAMEEYSKDPNFSFKKVLNDLHKRLESLASELHPGKK